MMSIRSVSCPRTERGAPMLEANMGGPMSRSRTEHIRSSLLGREDGPVKVPRVIRLGLWFGMDVDPVEAMTQLIAEEGYASPEDMRGEFAIPDIRLICRPLTADGDRLHVSPASPRLELLTQGLMLGLCSAQLFDPSRPVLWTQTSLTRGLELYDPRGFYA